MVEIRMIDLETFSALSHFTGNGSVTVDGYLQNCRVSADFLFLGISESITKVTILLKLKIMKFILSIKKEP